MKYVKYIMTTLMLISVVSIMSSCSDNGEKEVEVNSEKEVEVNSEKKVEEVNNVKTDFGYYQITQDVAKEMIDNEKVVILDVREEEEYEEGHIENSVLLPLGEVTYYAERIIPNKDEIILVYCRSGNRSKQASYFLAELGYTNVYEFGGINTWEYGIVK